MLLAERLAIQARPRVRRHIGPPPEGAIVFGAAALGYLALTVAAAVRFHLVTAQALGQVANAAYVVLGRDPHLAALGFIGSPIPSVLLVPIVPFGQIWPALTEAGLAACIVSAVFMAGAVYQGYQLLRESGVGPVPRVVLTALLALHPLILYTAVTGMGEAALVFFLLMAVRHLARWLRTGDTTGEVVAGFALAGAYLTRYDAVLAAAGAVLLVAVVSFKRAPAQRLWTALSDAVIVSGPVVAAIAVWAAAAWLVTSSPFPQVWSTYGYLPQLEALRSHGASLFDPGRTLAQVLSLAPALPAAGLLLGGIIGRRDRGRLAVTAVLAPLAVAVVVAGLLGWAFPWLRLLIVVVPLSTLLIGLGLAGADPSRGARRRSWAGPVAAALMLAVALPTTVAAMANARTGQEERPVLNAIVGRSPASAPSAAFASAREAAHFLDGHQFGDGTVLLDSFTGFPIILASLSPRQFLITSDREFALALARPAAFGVQYVLVPAPDYLHSLGALDAVNRAYPELYPSGFASGGLVREFSGGGMTVEWRLYRVSVIRPATGPITGP